MELVQTISAEPITRSYSTGSRKVGFWERMNWPQSDATALGGAPHYAPRSVSTGSADQVVGYRLRLNGRDCGKLNGGVENQVYAVQEKLADGVSMEVEYLNGDLRVQPRKEWK